MNLLDAGKLLSQLRRDLAAAAVFRVGLGAIVIGGLAAAALHPRPDGAAAQGSGIAMAAAMAWALMMVISIRQINATNRASLLMAAGRLDLAERQLREALRRFSLFAAPKLLACHNLAVVTHGRGHYAAAARLCEGILARSRGLARATLRMTSMLLADCRLLLNDAAAAAAALADLDAFDARLPLAERLTVLCLRTRCEVAAGRFADAAGQLAEKVRLAELLDSPRAAEVHGLLAGACRAQAQVQQAEFLEARAQLYGGSAEPIPARPIVARPADRSAAP